MIKHILNKKYQEQVCCSLQKIYKLIWTALKNNYKANCCLKIIKKKHIKKLLIV